MLIVLLQDAFVELIPHETQETRRPSTRTWQPVRPEAAAKLTDSRLQLHHAAQFGAAAASSFLPHVPDHSHTALEWLPAVGGLFSGVIPARSSFRIGVRPVKLALLVVNEDDRPIAEYSLHGRTIIEARDWIRSRIQLLGVDGSRYTLTRHYEIPRHDVTYGESFDASEPARFEELAKWFANAAALLESVARSALVASEVRCRPHHYDEPYFYVSMHPQAVGTRSRSRPLWGSGTWHTDEWVGAVLPGSRFGAAASQERQIREFLDSAISACRALLH
jgi:hypothetical protein